ncbi:trypsin [Herbihabitans rhizosphaerae]|uniref:Trypsin n=1 Tax=Herbihabitans rhizosphaerae TaxID=1872711 RepID=A0A4Q7KRS4_9PSEU|nr:serine protease [Herbihabitans rhizosphaerae]RZS39234.1 trypsin [Herbihabitans rhizosphaerae]
MKRFRPRAAMVAAALAVALPLTGVATAHAAPEAPATAATPTDQLTPEPGAGPRVVNGQPATVGEFPFVIAGMRVGGGGPQGQSCTASIVGKRKILTAAHCMIDAQGEKSYLYGDDDLNTSGDETFKSKVVEFKAHPEYGGAGGWQQGHDVAVVTIADDVPISEDKFAKFATSNDSGLTQPGKEATAIGYGKTGPSGGSGKLMKTTMPINAAKDCQVFDIPVKDDQMICAGYDDGKTGTCSGDSGGPVVVDGIIVGVTSWGASNCDRYSISAKLTGTLGDWAHEQVFGAAARK